MLVVGAGPAGLAAALAAAASGARVIICDEQPEFGGSLLSEPAGSHAVPTSTAYPHPTWLSARDRHPERNPRVTVLPRTTAFGYFPHNMVGLDERLTDHLAQPHADPPRERLWQVRAKEVVLAAGAIERPLVFPGNDRPGIMLAGAARTYLNRYGAVPGTRAVVDHRLRRRLSRGARPARGRRLHRHHRGHSREGRRPSRRSRAPRRPARANVNDHRRHQRPSPRRHRAPRTN